MIPPLIDHVSTFTISLQTLKQIFNSMQIEWKNKNRPIYYPSVCLIASNFTTDQGNLKFKGIHLPSTPLIKYLSYLFLFFPPSKLRSKYIFITSTRIVIEGTKETQLLIESSFIVFFSRL